MLYPRYRMAYRMSAFSRSLAAIQALATATWADARVMFSCKLDVPISVDDGTPVRDAPDTWEAWISVAGDLERRHLVAASTGAGAIDSLLAELRKHMKVDPAFFVSPDTLRLGTHAVTCAKCGVFRSRLDTPDFCQCGYPRATG